MARRKKTPSRPDPLTEGVLGEIYRKFFAPLVRYKPEDTSIQDWMEEIFHVKTRSIVRYKARKPFRMPGLLKVAAMVPVQGLGFRDIAEGDVLWARVDETQPDCVDVEVLAGQGHKEQVFLLTSSEWGWVKLHVSVSERRRTEDV